jgi:uncharacterized membrane protein
MHFRGLRNAFISGLILLAPVTVTIYVIKVLVASIGAPTSGLFFFFLPKEIFDQSIFAALLYASSTVIVLALITLFGWFSKYFFGKLIVQATEKLVVRVPVAKVVYATVKQIIDTFSAQKKAVFQEVVLVEFPRKGIYAMGFLTGRGKGEVAARTDDGIVNIFLPTTPNPTSGYLIMVPEADVVTLDMSVPEGMKLIISGGAVVPAYIPRTGRMEPVEVRTPAAATEISG